MNWTGYLLQDCLEPLYKYTKDFKIRSLFLHPASKPIPLNWVFFFFTVNSFLFIFHRYFLWIYKYSRYKFYRCYRESDIWSAIEGGASWGQRNQQVQSSGIRLCLVFEELQWGTGVGVDTGEVEWGGECTRLCRSWQGFGLLLWVKWAPSGEAWPNLIYKENYLEVLVY